MRAVVGVGHGAVFGIGGAHQVRAAPLERARLRVSVADELHAGQLARAVVGVIRHVIGPAARPGLGHHRQVAEGVGGVSFPFSRRIGDGGAVPLICVARHATIGGSDGQGAAAAVVRVGGLDGSGAGGIGQAWDSRGSRPYLCPAHKPFSLVTNGSPH